MAKSQIDLSREGGKNGTKKFNKNQLVRKLGNLNKREVGKLSIELYDNEALYDERTIESANQLLDLLNDSGINYKLIARSDGGGILAKTQGLGGNSLIITVAPKDTVQYNYKQQKNQLRDSSRYVGNINANGKNYYVDRKSEMQKSMEKYIKQNKIQKGSPEWKKLWREYFNDDRVQKFDNQKMEYIIKGLTGQLPVKTVYNKGLKRTDNKYDHAHTILDEMGRPIVNFYRMKKSAELEDFDMGFVDNYMMMKEEGVKNLESTPLLQMIKETNQEIQDKQNEAGEVTREAKGFEETTVMTPITVEGEKLNGLNLDTLLEFHDRQDIAKAIAYEIRHNPEFSMNNPTFVAEPGLKDLLMEETAGVDAEKVEPVTLGKNEYHAQKYQAILDQTQMLLERQGIENVDVYFDTDHVMHWTGQAQMYDKESESVQQFEKSGQIGQIFLPDERGLIETNFKTIEGSEDRNYNMVVGYRAYYTSNSEDKALKPQTVVLQDNKGNAYEVVATNTKDENGNYIPFRTKKGKYLRPERLPEEELIKINKKIDEFNQNNPNKQVASIGTVEVEKSLRNRLRFRGYEQSLNQQLESIVSKQALQQENDLSLDNTGLNKLYHGDVYGMRISDKNIENDAIVETYKNRVKFEDDVLYLSNRELDSDFDNENDSEYEGDDYSHRFNIKELDGIFDRSLSSDGANLGLVRYFNKNTKVLETGEVVPTPLGVSGRAKIFDDVPFSEADPGDRAMMAGNQVMKSRNVSKAQVALMTYKGYTFEDGSVVSERFAEEQGAIVNGYDEDGKPIPLEVGDKISDMHGNKSTISYVASPEDEVFKENPDLDVIMNPHSIPSRMNTGVVLEMQHNGDAQPVLYENERVADAGKLNVVITNITAKDKTKTYENEYDAEGNLTLQSTRKGRSFGVQEAWVANALELNETMKEIYGNNVQPFEKLKSYMNVTGLDFDENTNMILSNGYNSGKQVPPESIKKVELSTALDLPSEGGYMELPIEVDLPSGMKTKYLNVMPEKFRETQTLYDGERMYHEYSSAYSRISKSALEYDEIEDRYKVQLQDKFEHIENQDLSQIDLKNEEQRQALRKELSNKEDIQEFQRAVSSMDKEHKEQAKKLQGNVNALTSRIIEDKLGGRSHLKETLDEYGDRHMSRNKDSQAVKRSIIKGEIMGKQVPNSVTSVVTAEPNVDIDTIKVSEDIYNKLDLKSADQQVLLWRDPALHDGSMRSFKVEKDENLVGVGINPLVTESFGMDFDGDTVGVYAPKSKEAQNELKEKASIEKNLLDATSKEFSGNIGMDFVAGAYKEGYIYDENNTIEQGPLLNREHELVDNDGKTLSPKDQLQFMLNEMAHQENGANKINELWKDVVTTNKNIAASKVDFKDRESFKDSVMHMAKIGAKGKPNGIENQDIEKNKQDFEAQNGRKITYLERMQDPEKYIANSSTVMDYYDRGLEMHEAKTRMLNGDKQGYADYQALYNPYTTVELENGEKDQVRNLGSLAYDQDKTRMAQSGKTDLTGLAGAKSQTLVSLMYDKENGAMAAMEVTEPLTQATLKLKHDPALTPEIKALMSDYDDMLNKGGYTKEEFTNDFKEMYDKVGLDVRDEHLHEVFATLSEKDEQGIERTTPIQDKIEKDMSPLLKANLYGYDAMKESASGIEKRTELDNKQYETMTLNRNNEWELKDTSSSNKNYGNMGELKAIALGKTKVEDAQFNNFKQGPKSAMHIPAKLNTITISNREKIAEKFAKENECGMYKNMERSNPPKKMQQQPGIKKVEPNNKVRFISEKQTKDINEDISREQEELEGYDMEL